MPLPASTADEIQFNKRLLREVLEQDIRHLVTSDKL
jgi:hypothetical protein